MTKQYRDPAPTAVIQPITTEDNVDYSFRESFETYSNTRWIESKSSGDIIQLDGNALGASYLVISKSPFNQGTESYIETTNTFYTCIESIFGVHMSQRVAGIDTSIELISTNTVTASANATISSISQTTTTLTVNTASSHGYVPGQRIAISGVSDSRFNYPAITVATVPASNQFTVTAGPAGTITSLTAGPITGSGVISSRPAMSSARDGMSLVFENGTVTSGAFFVRADGSADLIPSGTVNGNHGITLATTASVAALSAAYTYAWQPASEYKFIFAPDKLQLLDNGVDSINAWAHRLTRTQVVPNPETKYKLRIKMRTSPSMTVPVAKIVSATKSGSTTATVVTDVPHGLTTSSWIVAYGNRDTTNFANITTATQVASIVDATTFTIVWGSAVTATGYGGHVALVNGNFTGYGAVTQCIQSAVLAGGILTLTGSGSWSGVSIGDYVNVYGCRNATGGTDMGVDGAWKVRNVATTSLELEALPGTIPPADFGSTNCGGSVIRRTDLRLSYVRLFSFTRNRVEQVTRNGSDAGSSIPVSLAASGATVSVQGSSADNSSTVPNPNLISALMNSTAGGPTAGSSGRQGQLQADLSRRLVVTHGGVPQSHDFNRVTVSTTTETTLIAAVASIRHEIHHLTIANRDTAACTVDIRDTTTGTVRNSIVVPAGTTQYIPFTGGLPQAAVNTNWTVQLRAAITTNAVEISSSSYRTTA